MLSQENYEAMQSFTIEKIPNLDICVLGALEFLSELELPKIKIRRGRMLVIGSENALATGKIIFEDKDAVFASESDYIEKLKAGKFDLFILVSASGGKSAVGIAKRLEEERKGVFLLTNNPDAMAAKFAKEVLVFPRQREPYTYNTSTYLSIILSATGESPEKIYNFIKKLEAKIPKNLSEFDAFYFILPSEFDAVRSMIATKFDELFGAKISGRVFTDEQTKHAKTVVPSVKEMFVGLGVENVHYGKHRFNIKLPSGSGYGMMMAVGYYLVGKIQKANKPFFKKNIIGYTRDASKIFKEEIKPIVE